MSFIGGNNREILEFHDCLFEIWTQLEIKNLSQMNGISKKVNWKYQKHIESVNNSSFPNPISLLFDVNLILKMLTPLALVY